jgi:hypothetical protein
MANKKDVLFSKSTSNLNSKVLAILLYQTWQRESTAFMLLAYLDTLQLLQLATQGYHYITFMYAVILFLLPRKCRNT